MTAIAAIYQGGHAWMASDTRSSWGSEYIDGNPKCRRIGAALVGLAGQLCYNRALACAPMDPLPEDADAAASEAWCCALVDHLRAWGAEHGHGQQRDGSTDHNFTVLVATPAGLWRLSCDGAVSPVSRGWDAIGSGGAEARGSIHGQLDLYRYAGGLDHQSVVATAIRSAIALDSSCGGDAFLVSL